MRDEHPDAVPEDREIGALYALTREAAHTPQPAPEVEARIHEAARAAAARGRAPHAAFAGWAAAAVVVLAVTLVWQSARDPASPAPLGEESRIRAIGIGAAASRTAPAAESSVRREMAPVAAGSAASVPAPQPPAAPAAELQAPLMAPLLPVAGGALAETELRIAPPAADPARAQADASAATAATPQRAAQDGVAPPSSRPRQAAAKAALAAPAAGQPAPDTGDERLLPVRALLAEGRTGEARVALERLLAEDPSIVLDEELRALLAATRSQ